MINYDTAHRIVTAAHAGQTEKDGRPYIGHLERVAALVAPEHRILALCHDLFEDTDVDDAQLLAQVGHRRSLAWLQLFDDINHLSSDPYSGQTYAEFIAAIVQHGSYRALLVKFADVVDHLRPGYQFVLNPHQIDRYIRAFHALLAEIERRDLSVYAATVRSILQLPPAVTKAVA